MERLKVLEGERGEHVTAGCDVDSLSSPDQNGKELKVSG